MQEGNAMNCVDDEDLDLTHAQFISKLLPNVGLQSAKLVC